MTWLRIIWNVELLASNSAWDVAYKKQTKKEEKRLLSSRSRRQQYLPVADILISLNEISEVFLPCQWGFRSWKSWFSIKAVSLELLFLMIHHQNLKCVGNWLDYYPQDQGHSKVQKSHLLRTQSLGIFPTKSGVGQYRAIHVTLTARDFFLADFYCKILRISYKDHTTNEEVHAKIQQAIGPHEDDLTIVRDANCSGMVMFPVHEVWLKPSCKAQWKGEEDKADRGRGGKTASGKGQAWSLPSSRGQWRTGKNGERKKKVVKSSVVPSQLRDRWWWWWWWWWWWLKICCRLSLL